MGPQPLHRCPRDSSSASRLLAVLTLLMVAVTFNLHSESGIHQIRHEGFASLSKGRFGDAGTPTSPARDGFRPSTGSI